MTEDYFLERNQRLSQSLLWALQKKAYLSFGPEAWFSKQVPFYLTSHPLIARQYAQIVLAFFRDCLRLQSVLHTDFSAPFYIMDLGAGTGRFAYLFLIFLKEMLTNLKLPYRIRYVMTDIAEANIQFWKKHPRFQELLSEGSLDFAYYEHSDTKKSFQLLHSGDLLTPETLKNPLTVIGNYFFDTIPQDLFCIQQHHLQEGLISLNCPSSAIGLSSEDPAIIPHLMTHLKSIPLESFRGFNIDLCGQKVLEDYTEIYESLPFFLFPTGALQVIRFFREFSHERVLFLTGDQGITSDKQIMKEIPFLAKHGTFSMLVNYDLIQRYFKKFQGVCLLTPSLNSMMVNMAAISCLGCLEFFEVQEAFRLGLEMFEPQDYFQLVKSASQWDTPPLMFMLELIKWGVWDSVNFNLFFEKIRKTVIQTTVEEKEALKIAIQGCRKFFFPVSKEEGAFMMNLGVLFFDMKMYEEAESYFQEALKMGYDHPLIYKNILLAHHAKARIHSV